LVQYATENISGQQLVLIS